MIFAHLLTDVNEANMFIIACEKTRRALLVDAASFDPRIQSFLEAHDLSLESVFITHDHYDHTGELAAITHAFKPAVYAGAASVAGIPVACVKQDDALTLGDIEMRVIELPGHTHESIGLVLPDMVFTGDALFAGSIGGTVNERAKKREIDAIRNQVFSLPDDYLVHTGHGPSSTVGVEKRYNPFFVRQ